MCSAHSYNRNSKKRMLPFLMSASTSLPHQRGSLLVRFAGAPRASLSLRLSAHDLPLCYRTPALALIGSDMERSARSLSPSLLGTLRNVDHLFSMTCGLFCCLRRAGSDSRPTRRVAGRLARRATGVLDFHTDLLRPYRLPRGKK